MKIHWRFLKYDLTFQTLFFLINTLLIFGGILINDLFIYVLLLQIFIGFYQVAISGLVNLIKEGLDHRIMLLRKIHFWGGISYCIQLGLLVSWFPGVLQFIILFIIPQIIAYAYYILTLKDYQSRKNYLESRPTIFAY